MSNREAARVTTVIPTFERAYVLGRAIASAAGQPGVRVRVCDNASADETPQVVSSFREMGFDIEYFRHERNIGPAANFEFAVRGLSTPYFTILSDDDYLVPGAITDAVHALDQNPDAEFWVGTTINVGPDGRVWDARLDRWPRDGLYLPPEAALQMTAGRAPAWTGMVLRTRTIEEFGFIDPEAKGPADLDFTLRLAMRYPFIVERRAAAVFSLNENTYSESQPLSSFWPGWKKMFRNVQEADGVDPATKRHLLRALHSDARRMLFRRGASAIARGRYEFAKDAAQVLGAEYGRHVRAFALRMGARLAERSDGVARLLRWSYGRAEQRLVQSRGDLEEKYSKFLQGGPGSAGQMGSRKTQDPAEL